MADTHSHPSSDLHAMAHVYALPHANLHLVADTEGRADVHAVPDLYTMAYVDTDTCAYCHGSTYTHADGDRAHGDTGTYSYGSTDTYASCYPAADNASADGHTCTHSGANPSAHGDTGSKFERSVRYQMG